MTYTDPLQVISAIANAFREAELRLTPQYPGRNDIREPLDFIAFNQTFSDTSCGFGGMAGQAFTTAPVVVIFREHLGQAAVFVGGRFAYVVEPNEHPKLAENFWALLDVKHRTIEAFDWKRQTIKEPEGKKP